MGNCNKQDECVWFVVIIVVVVDVPQLGLRSRDGDGATSKKAIFPSSCERKAQRSSGTKLTNVFVKLNKKDRQNTV